MTWTDFIHWLDNRSVLPYGGFGGQGSQQHVPSRNCRNKGHDAGGNGLQPRALVGNFQPGLRGDPNGQTFLYL